MLLTITTTHSPATDLGYLLHKNPSRLRMSAISKLAASRPMKFGRSFTPRTGGHVGFVSGKFPGHLDWLPRRIMKFFTMGS